MTNRTTSESLAEREERSDAALCVIVVDGGQVSTVPLPKRGTLLIGRSVEAHIKVTDSRASREHARLHIGDRIEVEDLRSANGTLLRNRRLAPGAREPVSLAQSMMVGGAVLIIQPAAPTGKRRESGIRLLRERSLESIIPTGAVVEDERMRRVYALAGRAAVGEVNVLILGESGSGKELLAETIHRCSPRAESPLLSLSCAALSESLLESELFGYERGAFAGATQSKPGLLEAAPGGTVFLDEIGEMAPTLQAKLLRVLETKQLLRIGSSRPRPIDVRFVSATNRLLAHEVTRGRFRRDLYFRLNTMTIQVPPLRERPTDILPLARNFVAKLFAETGHAAPPTLDVASLRVLEEHSWPGNVRELRGAIHRALLLCESVISPEHLALDDLGPPAVSAEPAPIGASAARDPFQAELAALERRRIMEALELCSGNQTRASQHLGISRRTLLNRLDEYGVSRPRKRSARS